MSSEDSPLLGDMNKLTKFDILECLKMQHSDDMCGKFI